MVFLMNWEFQATQTPPLVNATFMFSIMAASNIASVAQKTSADTGNDVEIKILFALASTLSPTIMEVEHYPI